MKINFASTRMAFVLIAILLILIIISAIIPQKEIAQDRIVDWQKLLGDNYIYITKLKLDQIYTNPVFFIVVGLLGINLIFGNIKRFKTIYRTERTLLKARHIGSIVFHFSLLLIIVGVILNYLFKSDVAFALTEGQAVNDRPEQYHLDLSGPLYANSYDRFVLKLDSLDLKHQIGDDITQIAYITVTDPASSNSVTTGVRTNQPLDFGGFEYHYGLIYGYSPELVVSDSNNQTVFQSFIRLSNRYIDDSLSYYDFIILPDNKTRASIEILKKSLATPNIRYHLKVENFDSLLYDGNIAAIDTVAIAGMNYSLPRLRNWCYINVNRSPYLNLIFIGFWLALTGLLISFIPRAIGK